MPFCEKPDSTFSLHALASRASITDPGATMPTTTGRESAVTAPGPVARLGRSARSLGAAWLVAATLAAAPCPALAQAPAADPAWDVLAGAQTRANASPGPRQVPARTLPVPTADVSPGKQAVIAAPYAGNWDTHPRDGAEWRAFIDASTGAMQAAMPGLRAALGVTSETATIGGVRVFVLTPREIPPANRDRLLLHLHGGGFVLWPGEAGTGEAILMAALGGFKVVSVDYRMPPEAPAPAAMDDVIAVWRELVTTHDPRRMAIFGSSTGGGMTLSAVQRARDEGLPLPAAMAPGTPWADLSETGDSYLANEFTDGVLVSWKGWLGRAALLYAAGRDLKHPSLSPIYGDMRGLPPAILTSGTRDLFLSNTVRTHRKLRQAGVEAVLQVFEGQSHAQFLNDPAAPETIEYHAEVARFLDRHLAR